MRRQGRPINNPVLPVGPFGMAHRICVRERRCGLASRRNRCFRTCHVAPEARRGPGAHARLRALPSQRTYRAEQPARSVQSSQQRASGGTAMGQSHRSAGNGLGIQGSSPPFPLTASCPTMARSHRQNNCGKYVFFEESSSISKLEGPAEPPCRLLSGSRERRLADCADCRYTGRPIHKK